jgi:hypothetical protein
MLHTFTDGHDSRYCQKYHEKREKQRGGIKEKREAVEMP